MKLGGGKEYFTAAELADLALPGMPTSKRYVNIRAKAEGWALRTSADGAPLARLRAGARGGGLEYHVLALPAACRAALIAAGVRNVADVRREPESQAVTLWRWFEGQTEKVRDEAQRRLTMLDAVQTYQDAGFTKTAAIAVIAAREAVSESTIWEWDKLVSGVAASDRLPALAPRRAGGGKKAEIDERAWLAYRTDYLRPEKPTYSECYERLKEWAKLNGVTPPHPRTLQRKLESEVDPRVVVLHREGAEAMRQMLPAQQRSVAELRAMEAVNIDGHKFDVFVRYPDGQIRRPMMVAIQDVHSRKMLAWKMAESENAIAVRQAFGQLFKSYGIPKHCVLDNGRAFASKWITGGAKTRFRFKIKDTDPLGLLTGLGIQIHWATPYRGQSKPIERAFRDLAGVISRHPVTSGAYTGNRPDAKPENYGKAAVPLDVFERLVANGIAAHNARTGRDTEMGQGKFSFDQVFEASYATEPATEAQLRMAMLTAEQRRCNTKTAEISLEGNRYWCDELHRYAGKNVTIRFDPDNLHQEIHVYAHDGTFIATAPVIDSTGFFSTADAVAKGKQEAEWRRTIRDAARAEDLMSVAALSAMYGEAMDEAATAPIPSVKRTTRSRGQAAVALKALPNPDFEARAAPLNQSRDRLTDALLRVVR